MRGNPMLQIRPHGSLTAPPSDDLRFGFAVVVVSLAFVVADPIASQESLVTPGSNWRFVKALAEPSSPDHTTWRQLEFDDSGWAEGAAPFYYGESARGGTELSDMRGRYTGVYLRHRVMIDQNVDLQLARLRFLIDDGLIVWINGQEVLRHHLVDGEIPFDGSAAELEPEPIEWHSEPVDPSANPLRHGTNLIAVHALNSSLTSTDFYFEFELVAGTTATPWASAQVSCTSRERTKGCSPVVST